MDYRLWWVLLSGFILVNAQQQQQQQQQPPEPEPSTSGGVSYGSFPYSVTSEEPTTDSTTTTTASTITSTTTVTQGILTFSVTIANVDAVALLANASLLDTFTGAYVGGIAKEIGVPSEYIKVEVKPGSVSLATSVTPPPGTTSASLDSALRNSITLGSTITDSVSSVEGIAAVATGSIGVSAITTPPDPSNTVASCPRPTETCLPYIDNGAMFRRCRETTLLGNGDPCTTMCHSGMVPSVPLLGCAAGSFVPPTFHCEKSGCQAKGYENTELPACAEGVFLKHNQVCSVQCLQGYQPEQASISCINGRLDIRCNPINCSVPHGIDNAAPSFACGPNVFVVPHGERCFGECEKPYSATPTATVCVKGQFVPPVFHCVKPDNAGRVCQAPAAVPNSPAETCAQGTFILSNAFCLTRCLPRFVPVPDILNCSNGRLMPSTFRCEQPCQAPSVASSSLQGACAEGGEVLSGMPCTLQCLPGFVAEPALSVCKDNVFDTSSFKCLPVNQNPCLQPQGIVHADTQPCHEIGPIPDKGFCRARCKQGFEPSFAMLRCVMGNLVPPSFTCLEAPCLVPRFVNASSQACQETTSNTLQSGSSCTPMCDPGFVPSKLRIECRQGTLSPPTFTCLDWNDLSIQIGPRPQDVVCKVGETCFFQVIHGSLLRKNDRVRLMSSCSNAEGESTPPSGGFPDFAVEPTSPCANNYNLGKLQSGTVRVCWCSGSVACAEGPKAFNRQIGTLEVRCPFGSLLRDGECVSSSCSAPTGIEGAAEQPCVEGAKIPDGGGCFARCNGTRAPSPLVLSCSNSILSPATFRCADAQLSACTAPHVFRGATPTCLEGNSVAHGAVCTPRCLQGYSSTASSLKCSDGALFPGVFACNDSPCPMPTGVTGAAAQPCQVENENVNEIKSGASCIVQCSPGHVPWPNTLNCRRGSFFPAAFQCVLWANHVAVRAANFGPDDSGMHRCSLEQPCIVRGLKGEGLRDGDQLMLLSKCGSGGRTLGDRGFPELPATATGCGASIQLGTLKTASTKVGSADLCFCPKSIDCGNDPGKYWMKAGTLAFSCPETGSVGYYVTADGFCQPCTVETCDLCKNNLQKFIIGSQPVCSCPPGYFMTGEETCMECGIGFFCPGPPAAKRFRCTLGSTTVTPTATAEMQCMCDRGRQPQGNSSTNISKCVLCLSGRYKPSVADLPCRFDCMNNADSRQGAKDISECFCKPGFYYANQSRTCHSCPTRGMNCPGGFMNSATFMHVPPKAKPGFFTTGYALVEQCQIQANHESVCLGTTLADVKDACLAGHTGIACGACTSGWSRDKILEACSRCEEARSKFRDVLLVSAELALRAAFALYVTWRTCRYIYRPEFMDVIFLRVWINWTAVAALFGNSDIAGTELYRDQNKTYPWPKWFLPAIRGVTSLKFVFEGDIFGSVQRRIECLADSGTTPDGEVSSAKVLLPLLWWLCYPMLVVVWVLILALVVAKCIHPVYRIFMIRRVTQLLQDVGGYSVEEARLRAKGLEAWALRRCLDEPQSVFTMPAMMMRLVGVKITYEIVAHAIYSAAPYHFENEDTIIKLFAAQSPDATTLRRFLLDPRQSAQSLKKELDLGQGMSLCEQIDIDHRQSEEEEADAELSMAEERGFPIFGLFASSDLRDVMRGVHVTIPIAVFLCWDLVTRRCLMTVRWQDFLVIGRSGLEAQRRVAGEPRLLLYQGKHIPPAILAYVGLGFWTIGFLVIALSVMYCLSRRFPEINVRRLFGFFFMGYRRDRWWWEIAVKRVDILLHYTLINVQVSQHPKVRFGIKCWLATIAWAAHVADDPCILQQQRLMDRLERLGLSTRWFAVVAIDFALWGDMPSWFCWCVSIFVTVLFVRCTVIMALTTIFATGSFRNSSIEEDDLDDGHELMIANHGNNNNMLGIILRSCLQFLFMPLWAVGNQEKLLRKQVPHLIWEGCNNPIQLVDYQEGYLLRNIETGTCISERKSGFFSGFFRRAKLIEFDYVDGPYTVKLKSSESTISGTKIRTPDGVIGLKLDRWTISSRFSYDEGYYEVVPVSTSRGRITSLIRFFVSVHYRLRPVDQRRYLALAVSDLVIFLVLEGKMMAFPEALSDFIVLFPLAVRMVHSRKCGALNLNRPSLRGAIVREIQKIVHERAQERSVPSPLVPNPALELALATKRLSHMLSLDNVVAAAAKQGAERNRSKMSSSANSVSTVQELTIINDISRQRSFTHAANCDFAMLYGVTTDELVRAIALLRQLSTEQGLQEFLLDCFDSITRSEDFQRRTWYSSLPAPALLDGPSVGLNAASHGYQKAMREARVQPVQVLDI